MEIFMAKFFMSYQKFRCVVLSQKSLKFGILVAELGDKMAEVVWGLKAQRQKGSTNAVAPTNVKSINAFNALNAGGNTASL